MTYYYQKGISLVIALLIMTIMLAIVLSISTILFNEIKIISNVGNSISSFNSAESGIEKTLYFDRKQIPNGASRGFCNICNVCALSDCQNCSATPLALNGCSLTVCNNCEVSYNSTFDGRNYKVNAKVTPNQTNPNISDFYINSLGFYKETTRIVENTSTKYLVLNPAPTTTKISPTSKKQGSKAFDLTITGTNFITSSVVNFNGSQRATTFTNSTHLKALIPAFDLTVLGTYPITVTNPGPSGGTSNAQNFTVK